MYTWGYIKDACLAKLDLTQEEANTLGFLNRFPIYANEVITQVSSSIKSKLSYWTVDVGPEKLGIPLNIEDELFICFSDEFGYKTFRGSVEEYHDDDVIFLNHNTVMFKTEGVYSIPYNARWFIFTKSTPENLKLNIPYDILDCIPSYVAHQCYKVDDEYKSSVYRNEYEMFMSRIDDSKLINPTTIKTGGDW